jgi:hypothetical protein
MTHLHYVVSATLGGALLGAILLLSGCTTTEDGYAPSSSYYGAVEIGEVDDFDEPLSPYGEWVEVESYGRCWRPARVERDWRPYSDGSWVRTDAGWYWESDEPWAWATYHYGRWDFQAGLGWYWVPHTRWAPAWVTWRSGGGYVGWAPLPPSRRFEVDVEIREGDPRERGYVFVQERRFAERVRPTTVIVNNTTIVRQTVNITKINVVNNTVINEGPRVEVVEQATGRKVRRAQAAELRRAQEAQVVAQHPTIAQRRRSNQVNPPAVIPSTGSGRASRQERARNDTRGSQRRATTAPAPNVDQPPPLSPPAPPVVVVDEAPNNVPNERNVNRDNRNAKRDARESERRSTNATERRVDPPPASPPAPPAPAVDEPPNDVPNEADVTPPSDRSERRAVEPPARSRSDRQQRNNTNETAPPPPPPPPTPPPPLEIPPPANPPADVRPAANDPPPGKTKRAKPPKKQKRGHEQETEKGKEAEAERSEP